MSDRKFKKNKLVFLIFGSFVFLLLSLWVGLILVKQPQGIIGKAAYNTCPGGEQCPMVGYPNHLLSCHPSEVDGTTADSVCTEKGRIETCGANYTKYCCPSAGGNWTTNMAACPPPPTSPPTAPPMIPPTLNSPLSNINCPTSNPLGVNFSWTAVTGAVSYMLNIDDLSNGWNSCTSPNANDYCITVTSGTTYNLNLPINKSYRWGVAANYAGGVLGPTSTIVNFTIGASCTVPTAPPTAVPSPSPTPTTPPQCVTKPFVTGRISKGSNNTTIVSCDYGGFIDCVSSEILINGVKTACVYTGQSGNNLIFTCNLAFSPNMQANCSTHNVTEWPTSQSNCCSGTKLMSSWDIDLNGIVNIIDIGIVIDNYAKSPIVNLRTDVNSDGSVDIVDIGIIIDHYVLQ